MNNLIILSDRTKEISYTTGLDNIVLSGPVVGFNSFSSSYNDGDYLFYAITDGTSYEIGSGQYISNQIIRFPFKSTNSNNKVAFSAGTKEVYSTYPATHSVYIGSGVSNLNFPQTSGLAFWSSTNILDYDENIVWDKLNNRLGINTANPEYTIDIGGYGNAGCIRVSGVDLGTSGLFFPSGNNNDSSYFGGRQLKHYEQNQLDQYAYDNALISNLTGTSAVFDLSGIVNQFILFKQQDAGTIFAGPPSGCSPPCSPAYPYFRTLTLDDFPFLMEASGYLQSDINTVSGILRTDLTAASGSLQNNIYSVSGLLRGDLTVVSGIAQYGYDSSGILYNDLIIVSGIAQYGYDSSGILQNTVSNLSGVLNNHTHGNISNSGTIGGSGLMVISDNNGYLITSDLPAIQFKTISNSNDVGRSGEIAFDSNYVYFHVPSGDSPTQLAWKRTNINIW